MNEFTTQELHYILYACNLRLKSIRGYHIYNEEESLEKIIQKINQQLNIG